MNNVVTINRKKLLSAYSESQNTKRVPEGVTFFGGVLLWMVLPALVYAKSGGPISLTAFAIVAGVGVIAGVLNYLFPAPKPPSIIGPRSAKRSPAPVEPPQRKAA